MNTRMLFRGLATMLATVLSSCAASHTDLRTAKDDSIEAQVNLASAEQGSLSLAPIPGLYAQLTCGGKTVKSGAGQIKVARSKQPCRVDLLDDTNLPLVSTTQSGSFIATKLMTDRSVSNFKILIDGNLIPDGTNVNAFVKVVENKEARNSSLDVSVRQQDAKIEVSSAAAPLVKFSIETDNDAQRAVVVFNAEPPSGENGDCNWESRTDYRLRHEIPVSFGEPGTSKDVTATYGCASGAWTKLTVTVNFVD